MASNTSASRTRVAIIGGGTAGLAVYRHLMAYASIKATIFESLASLGGLWSKDFPYHRPDMSTNISRHTCTFSDFPWPHDEIKKQGKCTFPYADDVGKYLYLYAERFVKLEDVQLRTTVESAWFDDNGWIIRTNCADTNVAGSQEQHFDYIIFTSGFFSSPFAPSIPGAAQSKISIIHSTNFTPSDSYHGKKVAVVGGSLSGVEIAGSLCASAAKIYHIYPQPFYPIPLYVPNGEPAAPGKTTFLPSDLVFNKRSTRKSMEEQTEPTVEMNMKKHAYLASLCPSLPYPPNPDEPPRVGISDIYASGLRSGLIKPYLAKIDSIDGETSTLRLSSDEKVSPVDVIILGTGYTTTLPYLSNSTKAALEYDSDNRLVPFLTHRLVLHPDLPRAGFVGLYRGPYFAVIELQARYIAALIAGEKEWPSEEEMRDGVERERRVREFVDDGKRQFPHGDYGGLVETYAHLLGLASPISTGSDTNFSVADQIIACNYPRERTEDVKLIERDVLETLQLSSIGAWVPRAVFQSWCGRWKVNRVIRHDMPGGMDGTFDGMATFYFRLPSALPTDPSKLRPTDPAACSLSNGLSPSDSTSAANDSKSGVLEYLYHEAGTFITSTGIAFQAHRKYIYRYHPTTDTISAWFVKGGAFGSAPDQGEIDYWFHDIVLSGSSDNDLGMWFYDHRDKGGWIAKGDEHLCVRDVYSPVYRFCFQGNELRQFGIGYDVRGPDKGYVSEAWYHRAD